MRCPSLTHTNATSLILPSRALLNAALLNAATPWPPTERKLGDSASILKFPDASAVIIQDPAGKVDDHHFSFDYAFNSNNPDDANFADQETVFRAMGDEILTSTFAGFNGCVLA